MLSTKTKKILFPLLEILLMLVLTLLLCEAGLRLYNRINPTFIFPDNSYNRFRGKPGSMNFGFPLSSLGFNDIEYPLAKPPETYRIAAIGDSFTFTVVPYDKSFPTLLEADLNSLIKRPKVEVLNMGIPSTGPREYHAVLVNEALAYQPDMVLVNIFIGNDFRDPAPPPQSYLVQFLKYLFKILPKYQGRVVHEGGYHDELKSMPDDTYLETEKALSIYYIKDNHKEFGKPLERAMYYIVEMARVCRARGIRMVVTVLPDEVQVDQVLQDAVVKGFGMKAADIDFLYMTRRLQQRLAEEGIEYLGMYEVFRNKAEGGLRLYKPNDTHWNLAGNRLAADMLLAYLGPKVTEDTGRKAEGE